MGRRVSFFDFLRAERISLLISFTSSSICSSIYNCSAVSNFLFLSSIIAKHRRAQHLLWSSCVPASHSVNVEAMTCFEKTIFLYQWSDFSDKNHTRMVMAIQIRLQLSDGFQSVCRHLVRTIDDRALNSSIKTFNTFPFIYSSYMFNRFMMPHISSSAGTSYRYTNALTQIKNQSNSRLQSL